jgi:hypothetical protein
MDIDFRCSCGMLPISGESTSLKAGQVLDKAPSLHNWGNSQMEKLSAQIMCSIERVDQTMNLRTVRRLA